MTIFLKDPEAALVHEVDWEAGYLDGLSLVSSSWAVDPSGGLELEEPLIEGGRTRVRISGGVRGAVYRVTNRVTLSDGGTDERSLVLRVEDR